MITRKENCPHCRRPIVNNYATRQVKHCPHCQELFVSQITDLCPAMMSDSRLVTNYQDPREIVDGLANQYGIRDHHELRYFLQNNGLNLQPRI